MDRPDKNNIHRDFSLWERLRSIGYAFNGIRLLLRYEHNSRIYLIILLIVIVSGILTGISPAGWIAILLVTGLVFISECFNTAVENLSDLLTDKEDENIRRVKDVAAAGVLIAAMISILVGLIIFIPAILKMTGS